MEDKRGKRKRVHKMPSIRQLNDNMEEITTSTPTPPPISNYHLQHNPHHHHNDNENFDNQNQSNFNNDDQQFKVEINRDYLKEGSENVKKKQFIDFITSKLFIGFVVFLAIIITVLCIGLTANYEMVNPVENSVKFINEKLPKEQAIWYDKGIEELKNALGIAFNMKRAKNVVLFVGDGMGPNTITASRIHKYGEEGLLSWEKFPHMGMLKTYCANKQVPDSMSTATALFGGVKTNYEVGGVDSAVQLGNCSASLNNNHHIETIIKWAQDDGMYTGFVTTTRVTHATPASLYAHVPDRRWECETKMPAESISAGCKDIARILVEDEPGKSINVIMGGGRQCLVSNVKNTESDPVDTWSCYSKDGRNLIADWENDKKNRQLSYSIVQNNKDLNNLDAENIDYVLGIFANGHLKYDHERDKGPNGMPSLKGMTLKALEILSNRRKGFLLVVEAGMIDQAHHRGAARKAISETLALDETVNATLDALKNILDETLIIVTADHSHTLTINGYPSKGNDIFGIASKSKIDSIPYTTLTYGTSYGGYQVKFDNTTGQIQRKDPSLENTTSYEYVQQSAILTDENTHGGSDVTIHAKGPMSHLFHQIHEQSYVAHVISYVLRIGRFSDSTIVESLAELLGV